jgi:hypothetical protein
MKDCSGTPKSWKSLDPLATAEQENDYSYVGIVDLTKYFCGPDSCPAIIGSVVPYFDGSHITATFARTLTEKLDVKISDALASLSGK